MHVPADPGCASAGPGCVWSGPAGYWPGADTSPLATAPGRGAGSPCQGLTDTSVRSQGRGHQPATVLCSLLFSSPACFAPSPLGRGCQSRRYASRPEHNLDAVVLFVAENAI